MYDGAPEHLRENLEELLSATQTGLNEAGEVGFTVEVSLARGAASEA